MLLKRKLNKSLATKTRHYVTIEERSYTPDSQGGQTESWSTVTGYSNVPAYIEPISSKRKEEYRTFNVDATHEIGFRGIIDLVESNNRIKFGTRYFEIKTIENIQERDVEKVCICLERRT